MAIEILPEPSIPITAPFRSGLGFLTATPIIAAATICLGLVIASMCCRGYCTADGSRF